jgi:hypothetical protein
MLPKSVLSRPMLSGFPMGGATYHRASPPAPEFSFPLVCAAVIFGLILGIAVTGVVLPAIVQTVVPAVLRAVTGA